MKGNIPIESNPVRKKPPEEAPTHSDLGSNSYVLNHYPETFSGEVHSIVYKPHNGFANFAIATLTIEKGIVKHVEVSQNYAGFETIARFTQILERTLDQMQRTYPAGFQRHV